MVKSTWPGVSMMLRRLFLPKAVVAAEGRVEQLGREPLGHRLFVALARSRDDPADAERLPTRRANLDRHLIGRPADAPGADFDRRHDVFERLLENRDRILLRLALDDV